MKKYLLFLIFTFFISCDVILDEIIENNTEEEIKLRVKIQNDTSFRFISTEIITNDGKVVFQIIEPGLYQFSNQFLAIYDDIEIRIQTETSYFYSKPIYYNEESRVKEGNYTFKISISELDQSKLIIHRIKT